MGLGRAGLHNVNGSRTRLKINWLVATCTAIVCGLLTVGRVDSAVALVENVIVLRSLQGSDLHGPQISADAAWERGWRALCVDHAPPRVYLPSETASTRL